MLGTEWWQGSQPTRRMGRSMGLPKRGPQHYYALGSMDESWMLACKGPSCTTGVLTVGRVESRRCPILCPNLKGLRIKYSMWKPDPRDSFLETRAPWKLRPSCAPTQCAVDRHGYAQLASSLKAMPSLICPKRSRLQDAASLLATRALNWGFTSGALVWLMIKPADFKSKLLISVSQQGHKWKN